MTTKPPLSPPTARSRFTSSIAADALEIGPFNKPKLPSAAYFDVLDEAGLRRRATELNLPTDRIPQIDFVSPTGDLSVVDRQFSAVFSSHTVEHQPNLIAHLNGIARILKPGGCYHLIIPDKRFCFDHYLPASTFEDVETAHAQRRTVHTPKSIRDHRLRITHNNALRHWLGRHGRTHGEIDPTLAQIADRESERAEAGEYIDVHAWMFTPSSFLAIMQTLRAKELIGLDPVRVHTTDFGSAEFFAVLRKP